MKRKPNPPAPPAQPPSISDASGKGMTPGTAAQSEDNLAMPHERDQSHGQVASEPDPVIDQARKDLEAGLVDTDMRATPGLDAARRSRMVSTPPPDKSVPSDPQRAAARTDRRGAKRGEK